MEILADFIGQWVGDSDSQRIVFVLLAAVTVSALALGLSLLALNATSPLRRRLMSATGMEDESAVDFSHLLVRIETMVGPVSRWVVPQSELERSEIVRRLSYAGFRQPNAMQIYYGIKFLLAVGLPLVALLVTSFLPELEMTIVGFIVAMAAMIGVTGPARVLTYLVDKRMRELRNGFPDALDLLVVCVESGLGLSAAIQRVADELAVSHGELAEELAIVNAEMRAGVDRSKALKNLADRTGLEDIRGLVSLLIQTMRFGTSVADALRVYSEEFRDRRLQKAEEQAAKISTKLIFPLVLCLFPSFFTVMIGPAVIRLISVFQQL